MRALSEDELIQRLHQLDKVHKTSFIERGQLLIEVRLRGAWNKLKDKATGAPYRSFDRFMNIEFPWSARDGYAAIAAVEQLKDIPHEQLTNIPRSNIAVMQQLSSAVRERPDVIEAAQALKESEFVAKIVTDHPGQHIEIKKELPRVGQSASLIVDQAIALAMEVFELRTREEGLEAVCSEFLVSHVEVEA